MFTCISCRIAFDTAVEQRAHFSTDWHRYNMKRRVANLPPVAANSFNEKVIERREQNAVRADPRDMQCAACSKTFSTENAYRSHVQSKKHRDREAKFIAETNNPSTEQKASREPESEDEDISEEGMSDSDNIEDRIAASRRRIDPSQCLFCSHQSPSVPSSVIHMSKNHSFFLPDQDILLDLSGLLSYLGEKVAVGNICLYCPNGGKEFGSLEAVRKHMIDKSHCKVAYDTDEDRAELADFYDYEVTALGIGEWEDVDDEIEVDEAGRTAVETQDLSPTMAPDGLSLVLPSGRVLGHRALKVYYSQRLRPFTTENKSRELIASKVAAVRQKLSDPTLALVPVSGGSGAFGKGLQVVKARNAGEAKWARRQGRSFADQRAREAHKTRVGYVHNSQKHFRDPLLQ